MSYIPPKSVQENAKEAKECLAKGSKAMLRTGRYRATQLASGKPISINIVKRMAQFERHRKNATFKGDKCKDKGYVAWQGWGGNEGVKWAKKVLEDLDE